MITINREDQDRTKNFLVTGFEQRKFMGLFRAKVVVNAEVFSNKEEPLTDGEVITGDHNVPDKPELCGRIGVWVPELMKELSQDNYIYAYPCFAWFSQNRGKEANEFILGKGDEFKLETLENDREEPVPHEPSEGVNDDAVCRRQDEKVYDDYGSFIVPPVNSFVYVFFEDGDPNRCRYLPFGPTHIKETTIQEVKNKPCPQKEFYVLKTPHGHRVFLSDNDERIVLRTFGNFFVEVNEAEYDKFIELWAPVETPPRPFSSDAGPIGEGNEATKNEDGSERKNEENKDLYDSDDNPIGGEGKGGSDGTKGDHGGPKATIVCKGGNGIVGSERTDGGDPIGQGDPTKLEEYLQIDRIKLQEASEQDPPLHPKGKKQEGDPLPGYRLQINSHSKKRFIQLETPSKYIFYMNEHDDDKFIKIQTEHKNRIELNEHPDRKYIQLETENNYKFYMNYHDDDKFIKLTTPDNFRLELNEHEDKRYCQLQAGESMALYLNAHEDDQFIKLITDKDFVLEINQNDDKQLIKLKTANDKKVELNDKTNKIIITDTSGNEMVFDMNSGEVKIKARNKVKIEAPKVIVESNDIHLGGTGGAKVITENSPCPYTGSTHTGGCSTTSAV